MKSFGFPAVKRKKAKDESEAKLAEGNVKIAVGTHALFSDDVEFQNLGLVIVDEQHRFGVAQRLALKNKGRDVHQLMMSATPIPRTLAMSFFADLDVSVIDELPPGAPRLKPASSTTSAAPKSKALFSTSAAKGSRHTGSAR